MRRKRYSREESLARGQNALVMSTVAVALLVGTWFYIHSQTAEGRHAHISLQLVLANVAAPLIALWLIWDWARYRKILKDEVSKDAGRSSNRRRGKLRNARRSAEERSR